MPSEKAPEKAPFEALLFMVERASEKHNAGGAVAAIAGEAVVPVPCEGMVPVAGEAVVPVAVVAPIGSSSAVNDVRPEPLRDQPQQAPVGSDQPQIQPGPVASPAAAKRGGRGRGRGKGRAGASAAAAAPVSGQQSMAASAQGVTAGAPAPVPAASAPDAEGAYFLYKIVIKSFR